MVTEISNSKYRLSKKGGSTEVILMCHGSWDTDDGKIYVPKGMVINFYSVHGQFGTKGIGISENILGISAGVSVSQEVMADLMLRMVSEAWNPDRMDQEIANAKARANAAGMGESMDIVESIAGRGFGNRQKVYNYYLAQQGPNPNDNRAEVLFSRHGQSRGNVDFLIMQPGATGHLKSAIKFAREKGEKYQAFHFLPCRWVDSKDAKSMKTVDPIAVEGEFFESAVI